MKNYYIYNGSEQVGPLDFDEIKVQKLSRKTPVWYDGLHDWTPVENVPELVQFVNTPPPFKNQPPSTFHEEDKGAFTDDDLFGKRESFKGLYIVGSFLIIIIVSLFMHLTSNQSEVFERQQQANHQQENDDYRKDEQRRINEELSRKNLNYRNNWDHYISVNNNNYSASSLGGIYGLEIVVTNNTDNMLDEVIVDVSYLKQNGDVWKQIKVPIDSVGANSTKAVPVDDVEKGVAVSVSVNTISSKKMNFYYAPEYFSGKTGDPNFYN